MSLKGYSKDCLWLFSIGGGFVISGLASLFVFSGDISYAKLVLCFCVVILGLCLLILGVISGRKVEKERKLEFARISAQHNRELEQKKDEFQNKIAQIISVDKLVTYGKQFVGFDANNKKMAICNFDMPIDVVELSLVYNIELLYENISSTVTTTNKKGTFGRAIMGGIIGGGVGAIVGASTAKQESVSSTKETSRLRGIKFYIKDVHRPCYEITSNNRDFLMDVYNTSMALLQM